MALRAVSALILTTALALGSPFASAAAAAAAADDDTTGPSVSDPATSEDPIVGQINPYQFAHWTLDKTEAVANGLDAITATIEVTTGGGLPYTGLSSDDLVITTEASVTASPMTETSTPGTYSATLTSTMAGTSPVQITIDESIAIAVPDSAEVTFTAAEAVAEMSDIWVTSGSVALHEMQTVTVTTRDGNGNPAGGASVTLSFSARLLMKDALVRGNPNDPYVCTSSVDGSPQTCEFTTDASGSLVVNMTSDWAGVYEVTALIAQAAVSVSTGKTNTATFSADGVTAHNSSWTVTPQDTIRPADGTPQYTGTFVARDSDKKPVENATVQLSVGTSVLTWDESDQLLTNSNGIVEVTTNADGEATVTFGSTVPNLDSIDYAVAYLEGLAIDSGHPLRFGTSSTWSVDTLSARANGTDAITATMNIVDSEGNPVSGAAVEVVTANVKSVSPTTPGATRIPAVEVAGSLGVYQVVMTSTTVRILWAAAYIEVDGSYQAIALGPTTIWFTPGPRDLAMSAYQVTGGSVEADGVAAHTVSVDLKDAYSNAASSSMVTLTVEPPATFADGSSTMERYVSVGTLQASVVSTVAGTYQVTASADGDPIPVAAGSSSTATFGSDVAVAEYSSWTADDTTVRRSNGTDPCTGTFTARDRAGNPVTGAVATIAVPAG